MRILATDAVSFGVLASSAGKTGAAGARSVSPSEAPSEAREDSVS
jgi:hypothetical protein